MRKPILFIASATTAIGLLVSEPSEAKPRPAQFDNADDGYGFCLVDGGDTNQGNPPSSEPGTLCQGAICYCCYDNGCYICDNSGNDCVWDGQARVRGLKQRIRGRLDPVGRPKTVKPGATKVPPRGRTLEPGLLEGGGGLSPQGPGAPGRPIAPPPSPGQLR